MLLSMFYTFCHNLCHCAVLALAGSRQGAGSGHEARGARVGARAGGRRGAADGDWQQGAGHATSDVHGQRQRLRGAPRRRARPGVSQPGAATPPRQQDHVTTISHTDDGLHVADTWLMTNSDDHINVDCNQHVDVEIDWSDKPRVA